MTPQGCAGLATTVGAVVVVVGAGRVLKLVVACAVRVVVVLDETRPDGPPPQAASASPRVAQNVVNRASRALPPRRAKQASRRPVVVSPPAVA